MNCKQIIRNWQGVEVGEETIGSLLANTVANSKSEKGTVIMAFTLAQRLDSSDELELTSDEQVYLHDVIDLSEGMLAWAKAVAHYLVEPAWVDEKDRKVFEAVYSSPVPVTDNGSGKTDKLV